MGKKTEKDIKQNIFVASSLDEDTDFIPLISDEDEEVLAKSDVPEQLPILPLRNNVLFPGIVIPITVGRDKSIKLIKEAYAGDKIIGVISQRDIEIEDPDADDLYHVGTVAQIIKILQMPDGSTTAIIQGKKRFRLLELFQKDPYFKAKVATFETLEHEVDKNDEGFKALISSVKDMSMQIIKMSPNLPSDAAFAIKNIESPVFLVNFASSNLNIEIREKQELLEVSDFLERANKVLKALSREMQVLELKNQIQDKVKTDLDKQQRDFLLNQQLKTIQEELGGSPYEQEINEMKEMASHKKWSKGV
ncbi:MAG: LON peptidase substrate-binding domain-containing protein, partial [Bacteroidales bacterium]|nr:LON peptidase substrate-binding domain-containing protein [Bacteroidales bacterium]